MKDYVIGAIVVSCAMANGYLMAYWKYEKEIAELNQATSEAVAGAEKKNASNLSDATNTILLAQAEYDDLRSERDRLLVRLRHANSSGGTADSAEALRKRVAKLESLVARMAETASRCGDGYQRCAEKHDALAEAVK